MNDRSASHSLPTPSEDTTASRYGRLLASVMSSCRLREDDFPVAEPACGWRVIVSGGLNSSSWIEGDRGCQAPGDAPPRGLPMEAATSASSPRSHILRIDRAWLGHVLAIAAA